MTDYNCISDRATSQDENECMNHILECIQPISYCHRDK